MKNYSATLRCLVLSLFVCGLSACNDSFTYDLVLRGGTIVDGSAGQSYVGDIAIVGEKIAALGQLSQSSGRQEFDVSGLVVAPGFLNIHSHAVAEALPSAVNMLSQGVTTEILNSDGRSPLDITAQFAGYEEAGLALNVGGFIGFNSVWQAIMGLQDVRPDQNQIRQMQGLIEAGLQAGAWGVSGGLDYVPGYYATTSEVIQILEPFRHWQVVFSNHDRVTPESGFSSIAGMSETIQIGEASGLMPLLTHMKVQGWEQGSAATILEIMNNAETFSAGGAAADVYPYLAGQTGLAALIIPSWAQQGGRDAMLARFLDAELRTRIIAEAEQAMELRFGGPSGVFLLGDQRELTAAMDDLSVASPGEAVIRLLEQGNQSIIARFGIEQDLVAIMQHPTASIACDCGASLSETLHPRAWGSYPKVLGEYVREKKALTMEDAIHKMTALPASTIGMQDRGLLKPGMIADIVVFDADTIIDRATYQNPTAISEGVVHTLVNGEFAWRDGAATGVQAGQALFRQVSN